MGNELDRTEEMYRTDPQFHAIVDMMYNGIRDMQYTPSELRSAAMLACIKFAQENVRAHFGMVPSPQRRKDNE